MCGVPRQRNFEHNPGQPQSPDVSQNKSHEVCGTPGGIRTPTVLLLRQPPPTIWATGAGTPSRNRTSSCRCVKPMPSHLAKGVYVWLPDQDSNLDLLTQNQASYQLDDQALIVCRALKSVIQTLLFHRSCLQ